MVALDLRSQLSQAVEHLAVAVEEIRFGELDVVAAANVAGAAGDFVQVVARHVGEHVVLDLKVQAAHEPRQLANGLDAPGNLGKRHHNHDQLVLVRDPSL